MSGLLIKTDSIHLAFGLRHEFIHWTYWKPDPWPGQEAFIVFNNSTSQTGLAARGLVSDVALESEKLRIGFHPAQIGAVKALTITDLKALPRGDTTTPKGSLAQKLYWHAHNKICELNNEEATFLRDLFAP